MTETPPLKSLALWLLARGPLTLTPDVGWKSEHSNAVFNSHTIHWIASNGWGQFGPERTTFLITNEGRDVARQEAA